MKRSLSVLILLLLIIPLFSEGAVTLSWSERDDVGYYRWRRNGGEWNIIEDGETTIVTPYTKGDTDTFLIEASYDGVNWSEASMVVVTPESRLNAQWTWNGTEGAVYRWRINGGEWTVTDTPGTGNVRLDAGHTYILEVQSSYDTINWSGSTRSILTLASSGSNHRPYLEASASLSLIGEAYHFYNGSHIEGARYYTTSRPGCEASIGLSLIPYRHLRLNIGYSYSSVDKNETILPDAFRVERHQAVIGFDVLFPVGERWRIYTSISISPSYDINAGYYSTSLFVGGRFGVDYFVNGNMYLGLRSGVKASHNDDEDPLYRSITYKAEAVSAVMGVKF